MHTKDNLIFSTEIALRISDINYGNHLGHVELVSLLHEARLQFFKSFNTSEINFFNAGLILKNLNVEYKAQAFYGDVLIIKIYINETTKVSFNLKYIVIDKKTEKEIANANTTMCCFDYKNNKLLRIPDKFILQFIKN